MIFSSALLWGALATVAAAQSAAPRQNNTALIPHVNDSTIVLTVYTSSQIKGLVPLLPLTRDAKNKIPHNPADTAAGISGDLVQNTPMTSSTLSHKNFALTNCNSSSYPGFQNLNTVIQDAIRANVNAIIFYSLDTVYCNITNVSGYGNYTSLYTLVNQTTAVNLTDLVSSSSFSKTYSAALFTLGAFDRFFNVQQSQPPYPGAGSTAVAMIILYSITGVITALFLIIITTGAIRAHRHPERYGPRNVLGRPRQSRAKGIARAMLDTIPIVKFGEKEPDENKDMENGSSIGLENRASRAISDGTTDHSTAQASAEASESHTDTVGSISGAGAPKSQSDPSASTEDGTDEALGCSICTDDFERGQDIRVLPCNHKFHPACVDPWLLEVSGTCPLCRVDLQPSASTEGEDGSPSDELPPPLNPTGSDGITAGARRRDTLRGFISARVNRRGLQGTSGEERLEILRRYREARRAQSTANGGTTASTSNNTEADAANTTEEASGGDSRLSRLSRIMRRRER